MRSRQHYMSRLYTLLGLILAVTVSGPARATDHSAAAAPAEAQEPAVVHVDAQPLRLREISSDDLIYRVLVAEMAARRGLLEQALEHYTAAYRISDDPRVAERALGIGLTLNDHEGALEAARRWHALDPENTRARQGMALAMLRLGRVAEAAPHLDAVRAGGLDDGHEGYATVSALLRQVDDHDVVLAAMETMLEAHPDSAFARYHHALAAAAVDADDIALESLEAALALRPDWAPAELLKARVLMESDEAEAAIAGLSKAAEAHPQDRTLRTGLARLLVGVGRLEEARRQFEIIAGQSPDDAEALFALGMLAAEAEQYDQAEDYLQRVLRLGQRQQDDYFEMGRLDEARGNYDHARQWYQRVTEGDRVLGASVRAGAMMARGEDFQAVAIHFAKLRRDFPAQAVSLYLAEAEILRNADRHEQTFDVLSEAVSQHPGHADLLYARALAAEQVDRLDILEADLQRILETDPDNAHALNALGYTLADRTERYQEALGYLERAIDLLPDDAAILDSMGWVKYRLGQYEESLDSLRRAYDVSPDDEIAAHLSEVLWEVGEHEEATRVLERAAEDHPGSPFLEALRERYGL